MRRVARCMACCFSAGLPPSCRPSASALRMRCITGSLTAAVRAARSGSSASGSITSATFGVALLPLPLLARGFRGALAFASCLAGSAAAGERLPVELCSESGLGFAADGSRRSVLVVAQL